MEVIADSIGYLLNGLKKLADKIRDTSAKVKANKFQCERLSERVDTIVGFLHRGNLDNSTNVPLKKALQRFQNFLERCLALIKKFVKSGWFRRILRNSNYSERFRQLNGELSQHCQDLNFGLAFTLYLIFSAEDAEDAKHDLQEIVEIVQSKQPLFSIKLPENPTVKIQTNIPGTISENPEVFLQDQYNRHWYNSLQSSQYVLHLMNRVDTRHHSFVPYYFW